MWVMTNGDIEDETTSAAAGAWACLFLSPIHPRLPPSPTTLPGFAEGAATPEVIYWHIVNTNAFWKNVPAKVQAFIMANNDFMSTTVGGGGGLLD